MMTSLQIILAIVGVLFVAAVVAYNLWQERKYRQEANRLFSTKREDVLLGESVTMENHETLSPLIDTTQDDGMGWRLSKQAEPEPAARALGEEVGPPILPSSSRPAEPARPLSIRVEGPIREAEDEDLVVPTHARAVPAGQAKAQPQVQPVSQPRPPAAMPAEAVPVEASRFHPESGLDEGIEYVARLRFAQPSLTSYVSLLEGLRLIDKPVRAMGKRPGNGWEPLGGHPSNAYEALEFGIQLADRTGALSAPQLERFCQLLYDFAAAEGGAVSCTDRQAALQMAMDLDAFCMEVDVLIGLTVVSREDQPFRGEDIDRLATEEGLTLERDGAYHLLDEDGRGLFSLTNQEEQPFQYGGGGLVTHGVTLLFDVPRVRNGLVVFDRMTTFGLYLADALGGRLVDDNGRVVNRDNLQRDRDRLSDYYARMKLRGIEAGSTRALRLFS